MIPQSVQTEEPDGPRDSIARDPQFGHEPAVEAAGFLSPSLVEAAAVSPPSAAALSSQKLSSNLSIVHKSEMAMKSVLIFEFQKMCADNSL